MNKASSDRVKSLSVREEELLAAYVAAIGAQTVRWRGKTVPLSHLQQALESPDRRLRERAWQAQTERRLADVPVIEGLWRSLVPLRVEMAMATGMEEYPALRRRELGYPPATADDRERARLAVEEFVTSVLVRLHERRRLDLGLRTVRPWDLGAGPLTGAKTDETTDRARSQIRHLEQSLLRWAFSTMSDAFEEWSYAHPADSRHQGAIGATWAGLWLRFLPAVDWSGLEEALATEWQRHEELFLHPGDSMMRLAGEVEQVRRSIQSTNAPTWGYDPGALGQSSTAGHTPAGEITDTDLLDVARWMEDRIEELERSIQ